jgi:preprotein translocase subunit SecG
MISSLGSEVDGGRQIERFSDSFENFMHRVAWVIFNHFLTIFIITQTTPLST